MKIAVVGATGMIGHHTARAVIERGHELVVIHRETSDLGALRDLRFTSVAANLEQRDSVSKALRQAQAVIHCAGYYPTKPASWKSEVSVAAEHMNIFFDAAAEAKLERVVYLGAAIALPKDPEGKPGTERLVYPARPGDKTPYVQVKWEMDSIARQRAREGVPVIIGIPAMCFGEYDRGPTTGQLIVDIANRALPGYIRGNRNVIYAGDAGRGLVLACEKGRGGERYLFTGANLSMDDLVPLIARVAGVPPPTRVIPLLLAKLIASAQAARYRMLGGALPRLSATAIAVMASGQFLDGSKAKEELGFESNVSVEQAIERALRWFEANGYVQGARGGGRPSVGTASSQIMDGDEHGNGIDRGKSLD